MALSFRKALTNFARQVQSVFKKSAGKSAKNVSVAVTSDTAATVTSRGKGILFRSFNRLMRVPVGGFKPVSAKAFMMNKPEGPVWRARTYTKHSGQLVVIKGFIPIAMEELGTERLPSPETAPAFKVSKNSKPAEEFAYSTAQQALNRVIKDIKTSYIGRGISVTVRTFFRRK